MLERYAGTATWAFGVDGDELYDPAALALLRADLDGGRPRGRLPAEGPRPELQRAGRAAGSRQGLPRAAFPTGDEALQHGRRRQLDRVPRAAARRRRGVSRRVRLGLAPVPLRGHRTGTRIRCGCCTRASSGARAEDPADDSDALAAAFPRRARIVAGWRGSRTGCAGAGTSIRGSRSTSAPARAGSRSGTPAGRSSRSTQASSSPTYA